MHRLTRCPRCARPGDLRTTHGYCTDHEAIWQRDRCRAQTWARWALAASNALILDTETTGLDSGAEVVELALYRPHGEVVLNTLVRPCQPIPPEATAIHRISDATVRNAPSFAQIHHRLTTMLHRQVVIVYNAAFDRRILDQCCGRAVLPSFQPITWHCAMKAYARYAGVWNAPRDDYRWHRLEGGDHSALGDCRATLRLIRQMAEGV